MQLAAVEYLNISGLVIDFATSPVRTGNSFFGLSETNPKSDPNHFIQTSTDHSNYQIRVNRTKSEIPSTKSGPYCKVPAVACGPSHTHPLWTKVIGPHIGPNRRHPLPNLHHFLTYLYKTFHPALFGSNLSWHCQFVISYRPLCKLLNDAKKTICVKI